MGKGASPVKRSTTSSGGGVEAAKAAMQRRAAEKSSSVGGRTSGSTMAGPATRRKDNLFYSEDSLGLQIQPKVVIIIGLLFLGTVVLLHIINKFRS